MAKESSIIVGVVGLAVALGCSPSIPEPGEGASTTTGGPTSTPAEASTMAGASTTSEGVGTTALFDVANPEPEPPAFECENPEFRCSTPIEPLLSHNGLGYVDARGCLRPRCDWTDECSDDEVCIMGEAWGECVAAVSGCEEAWGECSCLAGGVCNSAYCAAIDELPFELVDVVDGPVGHVRWVGGCSPDGFPTTTLMFGLDEPSCVSTASGPSLEITFPGEVPDSRNVGDERVFGENIELPQVESWFDANGNGISDDEPISGGVIRLVGPNTGRFELFHGGLLVQGEFSEVTPCPSQPPCG